MVRNLTNILSIGLISLNLNCSNILNNHRDEVFKIDGAKNESLVPINLGDKVYFLYKNSRGNYNYALSFLENSRNKNQKRVDIYEIEMYRDTIIIGNKPDFSLINLNNDESYDLGLKLNSIGRYDTIKPAFIYVKLFR